MDTHGTEQRTAAALSPPKATPQPSAESSDASGGGENERSLGDLERPPLRTLDEAMRVVDCLRTRLKAAVLGRDEVIELILVALLSDGHVLLEDYPGSGKTTLAKALGYSILDDRPDDYVADFRRIQFTPDLLPSDVTGVSVFDAASGRFHFRHGPIFAHVVLADEINRTSPKVQSAMLEAMAEKQVTVDNVTFRLDDLFFVIATQNPLDLAGTYPLPSAQLDRFLFKIRMEHIDRESELQVLRTYRERREAQHAHLPRVTRTEVREAAESKLPRSHLPRVTRTEVFQARTVVDHQVHIGPEIQECLVDIARATRSDERILQGASTRSLVLMLPALQARAAMRGRDFVSGEDIEALVPRVFGHRVDLAPGVTNLQEVLEEVSAESLERLARSTLRRKP
jgi:MoxR-like ATPase